MSTENTPIGQEVAILLGIQPPLSLPEGGFDRLGALRQLDLTFVLRPPQLSNREASAKSILLSELLFSPRVVGL